MTNSKMLCHRVVITRQNIKIPQRTGTSVLTPDYLPRSPRTVARRSPQAQVPKNQGSLELDYQMHTEKEGTIKIRV